MGAWIVISNIILTNLSLLLANQYSILFALTASTASVICSIILIKHLKTSSLSVLIPFTLMIPLLSWGALYTAENLDFFLNTFTQYGFSNFLENYLYGLIISTSVNGINKILILFVPIAVLNASLIKKMAL